MRKLLIAVMDLGVIFVGMISSQADERRTIPHNFRAFTTDTEGLQAATIYRITGVATGSNAVYGLYNTTTLEAASTSNVAVEGGEATSGDALPHVDFGDDGLSLDTGLTVIVDNCSVVSEYL